MIFIVEGWRQQQHHMHLRHAAVAGEALHQIALAFVFRDQVEQLGNDMAQFVQLPLADDVSCDAA